MNSRRFSSRLRTALVLTGEGTSLAYLAGVVQALETAGVRLDLVAGRGAGALVASFAALNGRKHLSGSDSLLQTLGKARPYRLRSSYRVAAACLFASGAFFLSPALLGIVSLVALPVQVLLGWLVPSSDDTPSWFASVLGLAERFYLPAIALPIVVLLGFAAFRWLVFAIERRSLRLPTPAPPFDLSPLVRALSAHLWPIVRGASNEERPPNHGELGQSFRKLLTGSIGQHGFRELLVYAFDTDSGREVPFVLAKERFLKAARSRPDSATTAEPIDLSDEEGAGVFFDALVASVSPPMLVEPVAVRMPLTGRFGGEVHRFCSSLLFGQNTIADAAVFGAEQVIYAVGSAPSESLSGSLWERQSSTAIRRTLADDLFWADSSDVPVFVIRPQSEKLRPFELSGRAQAGSSEPLTLEAVFAQGVRDAERLFIEPVLGEEPGAFARPDQTIPIAEEMWKRGPNQL